jgi:hypothetical protein
MDTFLNQEKQQYSSYNFKICNNQEKDPFLNRRKKSVSKLKKEKTKHK